MYSSTPCQSDSGATLGLENTFDSCGNLWI